MDTSKIFDSINNMISRGLGDTETEDDKKEFIRNTERLDDLVDDVVINTSKFILEKRIKELKQAVERKDVRFAMYEGQSQDDYYSIFINDWYELMSVYENLRDEMKWFIKKGYLKLELMEIQNSLIISLGVGLND